MASAFKREEDKGVKGGKWTAVWRDAEAETWKQKKGYTDRGLTVAMAQRLELESARRREGFISPVRDESIRPIDEQLRQYITHLISQGDDSAYIGQVEKRIGRMLAAIRAKRLLDIDPGKMETALLEFRTKRGFEGVSRPLALATRNEYINSMKGFTRWAKARRKLEHDPLECLSQADESRADKVHPRRALTVEQLTALLDAALRRPEIELLVIRKGKNKGQPAAKVRPSVLAKARKTGINRRMAYMLAVWTGLRRSELSQLEWRDVLLDVPMPYIQLRAKTTKAGRDDLVALHPQAIEELRAYRPANARPTDRVLSRVPPMAVMKLDLAFAGIEYGDKEIGFADLHALRKTLNTMLATQGVESRVRQAQLRHSDPRLTEGTYFDDQVFMKPQVEKLSQAAAIPAKPHAAPDNNSSGAT